MLVIGRNSYGLTKDKIMLTTSPRTSFKYIAHYSGVAGQR